ncbi:MAG: hypothetical protein K6347_01340 [Campylobacterales bacterium]
MVIKLLTLDIFFDILRFSDKLLKKMVTKASTLLLHVVGVLEETQGGKRSFSPSQKRVALMLIFLLTLPAGAREIVDMAGRHVAIPDHITKVYSSSPPTTYLVYAIDPKLLVALNFDPMRGNNEDTLAILRSQISSAPHYRRGSIKQHQCRGALGVAS